MAEKNLTIRVSAENAGVARVMNETQRDIDRNIQQIKAKMERPILGPPIKPRFTPDEQKIRTEMANLIRKVKADTEKHEIRIRAKVVADEARARVFGVSSAELPGAATNARGLKDSLALLAGGGAAAGIHVLGLRMKGVTDQAIKLQQELQAGEITAGQMTEELLKQLPIYGGIFAAGRNIRSLMTGEAAEAARITREAETTNKFLDERARLLQRINDIEKRGREAIAEIQDRSRLIGLSPEDRGQTEAFMQLQERMKAANAQFAPDRAAIGEADAQLKAMRDELSKLVIPDVVEARSVSGGMGGQGVMVGGNAVERDAAIQRQKELNDQIVALEKTKAEVLERVTRESHKVRAALEDEFTKSQTQNAKDAAARTAEEWRKGFERAGDFFSELGGKIRDRFNKDVEKRVRDAGRAPKEKEKDDRLVQGPMLAPNLEARFLSGLSAASREQRLADVAQRQLKIQEQTQKDTAENKRLLATLVSLFKSGDGIRFIRAGIGTGPG